TEGCNREHQTDCGGREDHSLVSGFHARSAALLRRAHSRAEEGRIRQRVPELDTLEPEEQLYDSGARAALVSVSYCRYAERPFAPSSRRDSCRRSSADPQ